MYIMARENRELIVLLVSDMSFVAKSVHACTLYTYSFIVVAIVRDNQTFSKSLSHTKLSHIDVSDGDDDSPLEEVLKMKTVDIAMYLINHGCGNNKFKHMAFFLACQSGSLKVVKELAEQHNVNPKGNTTCWEISCI